MKRVINLKHTLYYILLFNNMFQNKQSEIFNYII